MNTLKYIELIQGVMLGLYKSDHVGISENILF